MSDEDPKSLNLSGNDATTLTDAQKARIERNRQRAVRLRQARLTGVKRSFPEEPEAVPTKIHGKKNEIGLLACHKDTGSGFFLEDDDEDFLESSLPNIVEELPPPVLGREGLTKCQDCEKDFNLSILMRDFDVSVCDNCKESNERHKLCTKTDAKQTYLLKDCDLDSRQPKLKFIVKKNPHNDRWGQMKLYYRPHVIDRAIEVWGDLERIEEEKNKRVENKEKTKQKNYEKRIKELRRAVRTSTWKKVETKHEHEYDSENETYDEDNDEYSKECKTCGHVLKYEKM